MAATKQVVNPRDLALGYSPGVAAPCKEIVEDPGNAYKYGARGNLLAVIANGTAVLGLDDVGTATTISPTCRQDLRGLLLPESLRTRSSSQKSARGVMPRVRGVPIEAT